VKRIGLGRLDKLKLVQHRQAFSKRMYVVVLCQEKGAHDRDVGLFLNKVWHSASYQWYSMGLFIHLVL
jgi:hypothetical protein